MALSLRLAALKEQIGQRDLLLDIGCDHGLLEEALLSDGQVKRIIASDISAPSLAKARQLAEEKDLTDRMDCRLGDGFSVLSEGEAPDAAVLAGIGGLVVAGIIERGGDRARGIGRLFLLPSCDAESLRQYLRENHWKTVSETLVEDAGRIYPVMEVVCGEEVSPGGVYDLFGYEPVQKRQKEAKTLAERHLAAMEKALRQMEKAGQNVSPRADEVRRQIEETKAIIALYEEEQA